LNLYRKNLLSHNEPFGLEFVEILPAYPENIFEYH
jgi:hypothetical protein